MQTNHKYSSGLSNLNIGGFPGLGSIYSCGEYQVHHVGNMEYEVVHATTGNKWGWFQGRRLTNLSDSAACAQWHHKYDQEEI